MPTRTGWREALRCVSTRVVASVSRTCIPTSASLRTAGTDDRPKRSSSPPPANDPIDGATIRSSSLARQWRKLKRGLRRTRRILDAEIAVGRAPVVHTKRLRRRFTMPQFRNFGSYGRRSARAFGADAKMKRQLRRLERAAEEGIRDLKDRTRPPPQ